MKNFIKGSMVAAAMLMGASSFAQIQDERNVTITMELVPILQLNMNTTDQVNFVFDEIGEYIGGITKYGGTILTASSTVSWDLFASGTSGAHGATTANRFWDAQVAYGTAPIVTGTSIGARNDLPLTALELKQFPANINEGTATQADYGAAFTIASQAPTAFNNNVYVSTGSPYVVPGSLTVPNRYIAGGFGLTEFVEGGSYLTQTGGVAANGSDAAYYYVIDYRIVPGLPAIFPFASGNGTTANERLAAGSYAKPGVYTMNVKYLMIENQ